MTCEFFDMTGSDGQRITGVLCMRGKRGPRAPCAYCTATHASLCDGRRPGRRGTCDTRLCKAHAVHVGEDLDLCPDCYLDPRTTTDAPATTTTLPTLERALPR